MSLQQAFRPLRQLQQLWMSGNRLRTVPRGLPISLQRLLLDFNRIENLTDVFPTDSQVIFYSGEAARGLGPQTLGLNPRLFVATRGICANTDMKIGVVISSGV